GLDRDVLVRRAAGALGVLVLGAGLAGAWLVTNLWLGPHTFIATSDYNEKMLKGAAALADPSTAFALWPRLSRAYQSEVYGQVPVLPLAWTVAALGAVLALRGSRRIAGSAAGLGVLGLGLILVLVNPAWWLRFPRVLQAVQLPERLIAYVAIVVALGATVALLALRTLPARRALTGALVVAVAAQCAMGAYVALHTKGTATYASAAGLRHGDIAVDREPRSFADKKLITQYQFRIADRPTGPKATRPVAADPVDPTADTATLRGTGRVGEHRVAPVAWSPLVRVDGDAEYAGRTGDGTIAITVTHTDAAGRFTATVRPKCTMMCLGALRGDAPWQLLLGRLVTLLSAVTLLGLGVVALRGGVPRPARAKVRIGRRARRRRLAA
ncbi:MAG: hypothetical protein JWR63_3643, partial [Conexibacter sp.]|nr:hypothetical protein [Conexibacter sp.]